MALKRPRSAGTRSAAGAVLWLGYLLFERPGPFEPGWIPALLLLAPLVLVPLGTDLVERLDGGTRAGGRVGSLLDLVRALQLPSAAVLAAAFHLPRGMQTGILALPWLLVTGMLALVGLLRLRERGLRAPLRGGELALDAGLVYLVVGAAWAVSDRLGFRPLDFPGAIVLLTAVHFHYAGFALPIVTGLVAGRTGGRTAAVAVLGVVAGVPLVAVGITATQLGLGPWIEALAAWTVAGAGALVAWLHLRLALRPGHPAVARALWAVAALFLVAGVALAALYGSRFHLPAVRPLDIAWMQALHGSANALGFALAALLAWRLVARRDLEDVTSAMSRKAQSRGITTES